MSDGGSAHFQRYCAEVEDARRRRDGAEEVTAAERTWVALRETGAPYRVVACLREGRAEVNAGMRSLEGFPHNGFCIATISGGTGSGKTLAAVRWLHHDPRDQLVCQKLGARPTPRRFVTAADFASCALWTDKYQEIIWSRRLVLDDLGMEHSDEKSAFVSKFDAFLDHRWGNELPTIITTNIEPKRLRERYGTRVASRLVEAGIAVRMEGDYRTRGGGVGA